MAEVSLKYVIETIIKNLPRNIGKAALNRAQNTCPVQTGELYRSLYVNINTSSVELGANISYATAVEEGTQPVMVAGSYTGKWKRHKRRTKNGTTTVRGHTKTFLGKKPVLINGATDPKAQEWRTLSSSPGREGTFFLNKALKDSMDEAMDKIMSQLGASKH